MRWIPLAVWILIGISCNSEDFGAGSASEGNPKDEQDPLHMTFETVTVEQLVGVMPIPEGAIVLSPHTLVSDATGVELRYTLTAGFDEAKAIVTSSLEPAWTPVQVHDRQGGDDSLPKADITGAGYPERLGGSTIEMQDETTALVILTVHVAHEEE